ncbi:MAG TPA: YtxH domain-containing protein [Gemmatimonadales bacterium]
MGQGHDDQPVVVIERSNGGVGAFLAGLAFGAGLALLLAPQSGAETRELIRARSRKLRAEAGERLDDLHEAVETGYDHTKASIEAGFQKARQRIEEKRASAKDAVDAGKAAVRTARDELERRLADARAERAPAGAASDDGDEA